MWQQVERKKVFFGQEGAVGETSVYQCNLKASRDEEIEDTEQRRWERERIELQKLRLSTQENEGLALGEKRDTS